MNKTTIVATSELTKRFGRQVAVDRVSLRVDQGDIYGFLGLNGAGKTTTLRMILGLIRPNAGRVSLFGREGAAGRRDGMARIGAMVENPAFYGQLSGARNLRMLGSLSGPVSKSRIDEVLRQVGLSDAANKRARDYSLGMKQRLAIALALVSDPELVILDEPTNGLDPSGIIEMRQLIQRLNVEQGVSFIISSHLLHEIEMVCNRVAILEDGELVLEESLEELKKSMHGRFALRATPAEVAQRLLQGRDGIKDLSEADEEGVIRFRIESPELPGLHRELGEAGLDVFTLAEEKMSLEELFLLRSKSHTAGVLS